ncbi:transmembrane sensor [Pedobacter africanus]|uniref:Ferric-dicitrate binding protein FerR (Iron transport regulator) n=1 Tax=Pedobacter africanus TaxID=151894 RepID=A0ACC6KQH4_9SPHI|nr:FecR domain-containing protein [Pedobacter africanus]MDR6781569.1 ferric-dicitrate binding protein FerR (iron transport regulator) [Pedobacter africanus]
MQKDPHKLLEKYKAGSCSEEEKAIVESWYLELERQQAPAHEVITKSKDEVWTSLAEKTAERFDKSASRKVYLFKAAAWAAVVFLVISAVYLAGNRQKTTSLTNSTAKNDIVPGGDKAFLTLANGRKISLTDAANGEIAKEAGLSITKTADGQLVYTVKEDTETSTNLWNTIETPKGGKYQINLPDGTRVWLNAASALRYPAKFAGDKRVVTLTGEGYFEVAKNREMPFVVKTAGQEVQVLGTHFNINSYADEGSVKTTLAEGSVRVIPVAEAEKVTLKPGEQSELDKKGIQVKKADLEAVLAWKQGDFIFDGEDLKSIMRKVARWYDVEVIYKGAFDNLKFGGSISRSKNISSVLGIMEETGSVHFDIEGKRVTVTDKTK